MIYTYTHPHVLQDIDCINTQYYGTDAVNLKNSTNQIIRDHIAPNIDKKCIYDGEVGVIIGFEDNVSYNDYYYIIYIPRTNEVVFQLCNDSEFVKNIKICEKH